MTARNALDDILRMWGLCCDDDQDECVKSDAVQVLNGAMQFIFLHGKDLPFLAKRTRTYYVADGQRFVTLESDVQSVIGNVADTACPYPYYRRVALPGILSSAAMPFAAGGKLKFAIEYVLEQADFELVYGTDYTDAETLRQAIQARVINDARIYVTYYPGRDLQIAFDDGPVINFNFPMNGLKAAALSVWSVTDGSNSIAAVTVDTGQPSRQFVSLRDHQEYRYYRDIYGVSAPPAYFVECDQDDASGDSSRIRLNLINLTTGTESWINVDVLVEPPRVSWSDYRASAPLPFPHHYIESLLLPICRYKATCARRYRQKERHQSVVDQYQEALRVLGWADPQLSEIKEGRAQE